MSASEIETTLDSLVNVGEDTVRILRLLLDLVQAHERRIRELEARVA